MQILAIKQKDAYKKDIRASLIYSVVSISAIKHSDPVIHKYTFFFSYYLIKLKPNSLKLEVT